MCKSRSPTFQEPTELVCWYESRSILLHEGGTKGRSGRWVIHTLISFHFHRCSPSTALSGRRPKKRECSFAPSLLQMDSPRRPFPPLCLPPRPPQRHGHAGRGSSCLLTPAARPLAANTTPPLYLEILFLLMTQNPS